MSWVNVKTGPTGKERVIYGLYSLYDVRSEIEKALAAVHKPPAYPELDQAVKRYVAAYQALAPLITEADGYYERRDYLGDKMAGGRVLHMKILPAALAYLAERKALERNIEAVKRAIDRRELDAIAEREGRKARWQVRNVMVEAQGVIDLLPRNAQPIVDLPAFDKALDTYAEAVKAFDTYSAANPNSFSRLRIEPAQPARQAARVPPEGWPHQGRCAPGRRRSRSDVVDQRLQHDGVDLAERHRVRQVVRERCSAGVTGETPAPPRA